MDEDQARSLMVSPWEGARPASSAPWHPGYPGVAPPQPTVPPLHRLCRPGTSATTTASSLGKADSEVPLREQLKANTPTEGVEV